MNKINVTVKVWNIVLGAKAIVTSYEEADKKLTEFNEYPNAEGFNFLSIQSSDGQVDFEVLLGHPYFHYEGGLKEKILWNCEKYKDEVMPERWSKAEDAEEGWIYQWSLLARVIDSIEFA